MLSRILITLCAALALTVLVLPLQAQTSPATVATIKAAIQNYPKQIHSLSCKLTTTTTLDGSFLQSNNIPEGSIPPRQVEQGEWAFKGDKVINESKYLEGDTAPPGHDMDSVYLFDGSGSYYIHSENGTPTSRSTYGNLHHQTHANGYWSPLNFGNQLNGQWLSDVLNSTNPTLERVGMDPTYGQLYAVRLNLRGKEEHIWFAPKYGNIAVKIVEDTPHDEAVYTSSHYEHYGNFWMALQGDFRILTKQPNGQTIVQVDKKFVFSDIRMNTVPDEAFDFKWPTGSTVYDNDKRTKLWRTASGKWVPQAKSEDDAPPVRGHLSASEVGPWVLLACLAALLTLGLIRRRRGTSA